MNKNEVKDKHYTSDPNGKNLTIRYKKKQPPKWKANLEEYEKQIALGKIK